MDQDEVRRRVVARGEDLGGSGARILGTRWSLGRKHELLFTVVLEARGGDIDVLVFDASAFLASTSATDPPRLSEESMLVEEIVTRLENVEDGVCSYDRTSRVRRWV